MVQARDVSTQPTEGEHMRKVLCLLAVSAALSGCSAFATRPDGGSQFLDILFGAAGTAAPAEDGSQELTPFQGILTNSEFTTSLMGHPAWNCTYSIPAAGREVTIVEEAQCPQTMQFH